VQRTARPRALEAQGRQPIGRNRPIDRHAVAQELCR
jgi:hypothetical protein